MAEYLGPWGAYLSILGGVISGNLEILGTLTVRNNVQFDNAVVMNTTLQVSGIATHNDTIIVIKDVVAIGDPHIALRPATVAGLFDLVENQNIPGAFESGFGSAFSRSLILLPGLGGSYIAPSDIVDTDPPWDIPLQADSLGVRRTLMLHSLIFG